MRHDPCPTPPRCRAGAHSSWGVRHDSQRRLWCARGRRQPPPSRDYAGFVGQRHRDRRCFQPIFRDDRDHISKTVRPRGSRSTGSTSTSAVSSGTAAFRFRGATTSISGRTLPRFAMPSARTPGQFSALWQSWAPSGEARAVVTAIAPHRPSPPSGARSPSVR